MHACIECAAKSVDVFVPRDRALIAGTAKRTGKPYSVMQFTADDILDWKNVSSKLFVNRSKTQDGSQLNGSKQKWLHFDKGTYTMLSKAEINDDEFSVLRVNMAKRGRPKSITELDIRGAMKGIYNIPLAISKEKYKDFMDLCKAKVIRDEYHDFYKKLKHGNVADVLPEPDVEEMSDNDD